MEVHHHPNVEKKNFKEYFLEFLMIFLAVTMGFFAEGLREKMTENHIEQEYISSLVKNMQEDTLYIKNTIRENKAKVLGLDSLLSLARKDMTVPDNRKMLYLYSIRYVSYYSAFESNDATMMQLKNSGALRLIRHAHVADSIAKYDMEMRGIIVAETPYAHAMNDAMSATQELVDFSIFSDTSFYKNGKMTGKDVSLLVSDPQKIKVFFNKISTERGWTQNYINNLSERIPFCERVIALLKEEYE
jgi:hypothetical protein